MLSLLVFSEHGLEVPFVFCFTCLTLDFLLSHLNLLRSSDIITIICRFDRRERVQDKFTRETRAGQTSRALFDPDESSKGGSQVREYFTDTLVH